MTRTISFAFIALASAAPAIAGDKTPLIDPAGSYVLVEVGSLDDAMLKGSSLPGSLTLARYDAEKGDILGADKAPEKDAKKNASQRAWTTKPLAKSKTSRLYLMKVVPGTWVIEGSASTAFSLGSLSFPVESGQIVDLGYFKPSVDWVGDEGPKSMVGGLMGAALFGSLGPKEKRPIRLERRARGPADLPIAGILPTESLAPASFTDGAKFGNYLGGLVNRIGGRATRDKTPDPTADLSATN